MEAHVVSKLVFCYIKSSIYIYMKGCVDASYRSEKCVKTWNLGNRHHLASVAIVSRSPQWSLPPKKAQACF